MPIAHKVDATCPNCGKNDEVWMFEKQEGSGVKECYSCETCETEWTELQN